MDKTFSKSRAFFINTNAHICDELTQECLDKDFYIEHLENLLKQNGVDIPRHDLSIINPPVHPTTSQLQLKKGSVRT